MNKSLTNSTFGNLLLTTLLGSGLMLGAAGQALADSSPSRHEREHWEERQQRHDRDSDRKTVQARPGHRAVVVRELPRQARRVHVGKALYYRDGDRFYSRRPGGFVRVTPPAGVVVASLPGGFIRFSFGGGNYFRCDGVYYRPVAGGYLVVDPVATGLLRPGAAVTVRIDAAQLNVRSGPGEGFGVISRVRYGEVLPSNGSAAGWHRVVLPDGRSGWVMSRFTRSGVAG